MSNPYVPPYGSTSLLEVGTWPVGEAVAGPAPGVPTVFAGPVPATYVVYPQSLYGGLADDAYWINYAYSLMPTRVEGYGTQNGAASKTWQFGGVLLGPYQYNCISQITKPAQCDLFGTGSGTELIGQTSGMTVLYSHPTFTDGGATGASVVARHVNGTAANFRIDGTNIGAGIGYDVGDGHGHKVLDLQIVNCVAGVGLQYCNRVSFSEKARIRCDILNCQTPANFTNLAGANNVSMEYNDILLYIQDQYAGQAGVILSGGAYLAGGSLEIRGNFPVFAVGQCGPVMIISGNDGAGNNSNIHDQRLEINTESNGSGNLPQTIFFGSNVNNGITNSYGIMSFRNAGFVASNLTTQAFSFGGPIHGDSVLQAAAATAAARAAAAAPVGWV